MFLRGRIAYRKLQLACGLNFELAAVGYGDSGVPRNNKWETDCEKTMAATHISELLIVPHNVPTWALTRGLTMNTIRSPS